MHFARATVAAAAALLAVAAYPTFAGAQGATTVRNCSGDDFHYLRFLATYTEFGQGKSAVMQLDFDLEADKRSSYKSGQKVTFYVDGKKVGASGFKKDRNGDLDADLKLRSTSGKDFPAVKKGTKVSAEIRDVTVTDCRMN